MVTGGSTGISEATALHLRELGFSVLVGVRRDEDADRLREQGLTPIHLDVTVAEHLAAAACAGGVASLFLPDAEAAGRWLSKTLRPGDVVLVKGSSYFNAHPRRATPAIVLAFKIAIKKAPLCL